MRHDIRTPLSGITGFAELIKNETDLNKLKHYFDQLAASSAELLRYLNEILDTFLPDGRSRTHIPHYA